MNFDTILNESLADRSFLSLVLSKPAGKESATFRKVTVRPVEIGGFRKYQFACQAADGRETHENLSADELPSRVQSLLGPAFAHGHLFTESADYSIRARSGRPLKIRRSAPSRSPSDTAHNRQKQYLIPEGTPCPFLAEIGVMTAAGKVRAAKYHKFRQINRFLELVDDVVRYLPEEKVDVVDFGCGKSYLTFALEHLLSGIHRRPVRIMGLDRNRKVVDDCARIAQRLGLDHVRFRVGDIADFRADGPVDLAVSLHACDTATDDALSKAVEWQSGVILAAPCCQHELAPQVENVSLAALHEHGILKERLAALATDALRAKALEICGYRTQVLEFIDLEHTAKNLLIRAVRQDGTDQSNSQAAEEYRALKQLLGIARFHLETALGAEFGKRILE